MELIRPHLICSGLKTFRFIQLKVGKWVWNFKFLDQCSGFPIHLVFSVLSGVFVCDKHGNYSLDSFIFGLHRT